VFYGRVKHTATTRLRYLCTLIRHIGLQHLAVSVASATCQIQFDLQLIQCLIDTIVNVSNS